MRSESLDENSFENLYDQIGHEESNEKIQKRLLRKLNQA